MAGNEKTNSKTDYPEVSPEMSIRIYENTYKMTNPRIMNKLEKVPVILIISAGEFSLIIDGMTELKTPPVTP